MYACFVFLKNTSFGGFKGPTLSCFEFFFCLGFIGWSLDIMLSWSLATGRIHARKLLVLELLIFHQELAADLIVKLLDVNVHFRIGHYLVQVVYVNL